MVSLTQSTHTSLFCKDHLYGLSWGKKILNITSVSFRVPAGKNFFGSDGSLEDILSKELSTKVKSVKGKRGRGERGGPQGQDRGGPQGQETV